jgi:hypothetical protein
MTDKHWARILWAAIGIYFLFAILQIAQKPGIEDDEALFAVGTVHMLRLPHQEVTMAHDPDTWVLAFDRWFPLMTARYVGAIKEYLFLPLFAIVGTRTAFIRLVSILLAAIGIWGMAGLIRQQIGARAAAAFALLLAICPSYVDFTAFDNDALGISMATLGLLSLALSRYVARKTIGAAFGLGAAAGFMIWARANLAWAGVAIAAALLIVAFKSLPRVSHWIAGLIGGIVGGLPFLAYQIMSRGGTWQALGMFKTQESLPHRLLVRSVMFAETLLIDREHRAMWNGPPMPDWQAWLFSLFVILSCWICLTSLLAWARGIALASLILAAILLFSNEQISEHHLVLLLPFATALVVLAVDDFASRWRSTRYVFAILAALYVGSALYWQVAAIRGLHRTGGVGIWSDGIIPLAQHLQTKYPNRPIKILDWGFEYNLYVLTNGVVDVREIYAGAKRDVTFQGRPWSDEITDGGVFVLNALGHHQFPLPSEGFLQAFDELRPSAQRTTIPHRDGTPYAEVIEIQPNTTHAVRVVPSLRTADPAIASQLEGFHKIEDDAFRWTQRRFAVTFPLSDFQKDGRARLELQVYVPDIVIQKLGAIVLSARVANHSMAPETFAKPGTFTYSRDIPAAWLSAGPNRVDFELDKAMPPSATDPRELGIIVSRASLKQD